MTTNLATTTDAIPEWAKYDPADLSVLSFVKGRKGGNVSLAADKANFWVTPESRPQNIETDINTGRAAARELIEFLAEHPNEEMLLEKVCQAAVEKGQRRNRHGYVEFGFFHELQRLLIWGHRAGVR